MQLLVEKTWKSQASCCIHVWLFLLFPLHTPDHAMISVRNTPAARNTHSLIWESRGQNDSSFLPGYLEKTVKIQMNRGWSCTEFKVYSQSQKREGEVEISSVSVSVHTWPRVPDSNSSSRHGSPLVPSLPIPASSLMCWCICTTNGQGTIPPWNNPIQTKYFIFFP